MVTTYLDIPYKKWGIVIISDFDTEYEYVELMAIMRSFGLSTKKSRFAMNVLSSYNTGMAISRDDIKMSAIFISKATSSSQWWDSVLHEIKHVCDAIIDYYGVEWDGEDAAYLTGYLMKELVEKMGEPCI